MNSRISAKLAALFYMVFSVSFLWLFLNVFLNNNWYGVNPLIAFFSMIFFGALLFLFFRLGRRCEDLSEKSRRSAVAAVLLLVFSVQLIFVYWLRITPAYDVDAIYQGALTWNRTGSLGKYMEYFCMFPNNLGGLFLLSAVFRAADFFRFQDYNTAACIVNSLLINCSILLVFLTCRKFFGDAAGFAALLLSALCLPLLLCSPVFYTDTLTVCLPILGYYLYLCARSAESPRKRAALFLLMGLVFSVGLAVKATVVIMLAAILIDLLLTGRLKKYFVPCVLCAAVVIASCAGIRAVQGSVLDKETYEQKNIPHSHWVMMGLNGLGTYNGDDYEFTKSFPTLREKEDAVSAEIGRRVQTYNPVSFFFHLSDKAAYDFGDGLYGVNTMLDDGPQRPNPLHALLIQTTQENDFSRRLFASFLQGYKLLLLLLTAFSGFAALTKRSGMNFRAAAPKAAVFGLLLFLVFWESSSRYIINYLPVLILCAISGLEEWNCAVGSSLHTLSHLCRTVFCLRDKKQQSSS